MSVAEFIASVKNGDEVRVRGLLASQPHLVGTDASANDEHRGLHYAVLGRNVAMVLLLMEAGADARKGIYPHRDATSAYTLARERGYTEIVQAIEREEQLRRAEMSCPNATVSPTQDHISAAIRRSDTELAISLLEQDRSLVQACDRNGCTPLHVAAAIADLKLVDWLLAHRSPPNKPDVQGLTALDHGALYASADHFPPVARKLLEAEAGFTIRAAVALGDAARVRELAIAEPAGLRDISNDGGLVTLAVRHGQVAIVALLLDLGADVNERILLEELETPTQSWGMPLWHASLAGNLEITRLLLNRGADPNANVYASGWPLRNAWSHPDQSVKNLLLERGARLQPYMISETHNVAEAERLMATHPSDDVIQELLWSAADHGCPAIVERALPHLPWAPDDRRWHWVLIQPPRGASANTQTNERHYQSLALILQSGVSPNVSRFGQTVLHFLAGYNGPIGGSDRARFASLLLDYGADLHLRDDLLESTPLGWACRWGRTELVELLLSRGASASEPDAQAWATPKAWAQRSEHSAIFALLKNR